MSDRSALDEAAKGIVGVYRRHAAAFDRVRNRSLFEKAWLDRFVDAMPDGRSVLDLGCGMGEPIASYLVKRGCRITGVDSSPPMLDIARGRFPDHRWLEADMRTLSLDETFDGIIAWDSLFLLSTDDQRKMFPIFAAHSEPGTVLLFASGPKASESLSTFEGETLYAGSLENDEYRELMSANGFAVIHHINDDPDCDFHTVWLARRQ